MRHRSAVASVVVAVAALALSGCSALGLGDPPASPAPTAAPAAVAPALDCTELTTGAAIQGLVGAGIPASAQPWGAMTEPAARTPFAAVAAGGAWCGWGAEPSPDTRAATARRGVSVSVLPGAADAWKRLAEAYPSAATPGADYDGGVSLGGDCTAPSTARKGGECHTNVLVGKTWLAVSAYATDRALAEKSFHDFVQAMLPAVTRFDARATVPSTAKALPCGDDATLAELRGDIDAPAPVAKDSADLQTFRIEDAVAVDRGITVCNYQPGTNASEQYLGTLSVLTGGAAAYADYREQALASDSDAHAGSIEVGGQPVPTLVRSITVEGQGDLTVVDALAGTTWVQFFAQTGDEDGVSAFVQWAATRR